jgi:hypothetical protein
MAAPISGFVPGTDGRPYYRRQGTATQLVVDGKPFLALSGQLENNTISYPRDLDKLDVVLDICQKQNQNTLEIPVQWRALEPEEGKFDFTVVDALINECRKRNLRPRILWFGSWKNSENDYAPPGSSKIPSVFSATTNAVVTITAWCRLSVRRLARVLNKL